MRQSNVIFGTLLFAFIVYITMRGQLQQYMDLFSAKAKEENKSSGGGILDAAKSLLDKGKDALKNAAKAYATKQLGG